jgi:hypothetical protein
MLKIIALILFVAVATVLIVAAARPDEFRVQRTVSIKAAPEKIHAYLDNFRQWSAWSPFEKMDPAMKRTLSGAESGLGAVYAWEGNGKAGAGRMEITEASPQRLLIKLDFSKPMEANNIAEFDLKPAGDKTEVTWAMYGNANYFAKIMHLFFDMDQMVGKDFENGLHNLKTLAEQ